MSRPRQHWLALKAGLLLTVVSAVPQAGSTEAVDVELVLAVDVSLSMSPGELAIQRDGYAAAFTSDQVIRAIEDGVHGKIAVTYMEWAGATVQHVIVPWTVVSNREQAAAVAEKLTLNPPNSARRTSISGALAFAGSLFDQSPYRGLKRVIDISGDGPNNQGERVVPVRDGLVAQGITINGLPLMTSGGYSSVYDLSNLDVYYEHCIIGGPGAFMISVNDWAQFPEAVRRKLVMELAGGPTGDYFDRVVVPAQFNLVARDSADCEIGEKMWRERSWMWGNQ
jgi:hypothetical protein